MTLDEFLNETEQSNADLANATGIHRMDILRYRRGIVIPRAKRMAAIIAATGGKVTEADFYRANREAEAKAASAA